MRQLRDWPLCWPCRARVIVADASAAVAYAAIGYGIGMQAWWLILLGMVIVSMAGAAPGSIDASGRRRRGPMGARMDTGGREIRGVRSRWVGHANGRRARQAKDGGG